jgi:predicted nucleotidyltransferase
MDIDLSFIKIDYFVSSLTEYLESLFKSEKEIVGIILFGSLATENAEFSSDKISDIDLLIVFADNQLPIDHRERTNLKLSLMGLTLSGIDSIWMSKSEFKKSIENKRDIILSILDEGIILFDQNNYLRDSKTKLFKELEEKGVKKRKMYWIWPQKRLGEEIKW